jgi:hypothetical protein
MDAIICKPTKSASQSGTANTKQWLMKFVHNGSRKIEPVMGWISSRDMMQEVTLKFHSLEEAKRYAQKQNISYQIIPETKHQLILRSYAQNFK